MLNDLISFLMIAACLHTRLRPGDGPNHPQATTRSVNSAIYFVKFDACQLGILGVPS